MQEMCPFINILWPRFMRLAPFAVFVDICNSAGTKDTHDLLHCHPYKILSYDEVDKVVDVRQPPATEAVDRHIAGQSERLNILACLANIFCIFVQAMDQIAVIYAQRSSQLSISATQVDNQSTFNICCVHNFLSRFLLNRCLSFCL